MYGDDAVGTSRTVDGAVFHHFDTLHVVQVNHVQRRDLDAIDQVKRFVARVDTANATDGGRDGTSENSIIIIKKE